jgi:hypothetical protein
MSIRVSGISKSIAYGVSTIALSLGLASPGLSDPVLPGLTNLNFTQANGGGTVSPKCQFTSCNLAGWTGGSGLIYIDGQAPGTTASTGAGLQTYYSPTGTISPTANYVQADGNPLSESGFQVSVSGLTVGQTYTLGFYQAAGQQSSGGFSGATTNQWIVSLGTSGLFSASASAPSVPDPSCGTTCVYSSSDPTASIKATTLMSVPSQGQVNWEAVSVTLTADATTDLLSFLAWGDNGNTTNLPPIAFLSGVDSPATLSSTPLPGTLPLLGIGLVGIGGVLRRRRVKHATTS